MQRSHAARRSRRAGLRRGGLSGNVNHVDYEFRVQGS